MAGNLQTNQSNSTEKAQAPGVATPSVGVSTKTAKDVIESKKTEATGKIDRYDFLQDEPRFFVSIGVGDFKRLGPLQVAKTSTLGHIVLPIPAGITDSNHVVYSPEELGAAGAGALVADNAIRANNIVAGTITGNLVANNAISGNNIVSPPDIFDDILLFGGM